MVKVTGLRQLASIAAAFDIGSDEARKLIFEDTFGGSTAELKRCARDLLSSSKYAQDSVVRLGALSMLLHLRGDGLQDVSALLRRQSRPVDFEIHFSLFCRLERKLYQEEPRGEKEILLILEDYLSTVRSPRGRAAWMCGDLLHHWGTEAATRMLSRATRKAKFPAGRIGAIHGLQHILNNASPARRTAIIRILRKVLLEDPSPKVRRYANWTLRSGGCWTENHLARNLN